MKSSEEGEGERGIYTHYWGGSLAPSEFWPTAMPHAAAAAKPGYPD